MGGGGVELQSTVCMHCLLLPLLPCSFSKLKERKKKEKAAMCHKGTDWQTAASCLIYLFKKKKGKKEERVQSQLFTPEPPFP